MRSLPLTLIGVAVLLILGRLAAPAAPFAKKVPFTQPDGTQIVLWGQGDEFYAVFETLDGYTVVFNQQTKAYDYAALSADGAQLITTGVAVGRGAPAGLGLKPHARINPKAVRKQAAERFARWDQVMEVSRRWNDLKGARRLAELAVAQDGPQPSPPSSTTTGQKLGLTLLIDFSDDVATIAQAEIINFCNGDNYTGFGNNGSVKKYYLDVSNNQLTYSNVVTVYIRAPQPKSYYNNTTADEETQAQLLITDAIAAMKALPNYTNDILPAFSNLTVDGSSRVVACNVFFAGADSGVWQKGLWPHSWSLTGPIDLGNAKKVSNYQITDIGTSLTLGTFCHENGHMLCGFPDIYDYNYDSYGGGGAFCLMGYGNYDHNPVQVSAYLKRAAGWATTTELTSSSALTASVNSSGANFNKFYRYAKPGVPTEYFLVENRQPSGRDAYLPAAGVAVWHVDELGDRDNQSTNFNTSHLNYELSLEQADNLWHFQNNVNTGDPEDLYYLGNAAAGYSNRLSDATSPSARWWDGSASGIRFHHFSALGTTMTFGVGPEGPVIAMDSALLIAEGCIPTNSVIDPNEVVTVNFALKNSGDGSTTNLVATLLAINGVTSPAPPQAYGALVTNGAAVARPFTFTATGTCGGTLNAVLQLQDGANNLGTVTNTFTLGVSGPSMANYSSGGLSVAIPDTATVEVPLSIADVGAVTDVNVRVRINHTWDGDLAISLVHPDGTVITLDNHRGSSGANFGSGATDCSGTFTVFDDAASTSIASGTAPFAGAYQPEQLLSTLNGKAANGTWKLRVTDNAGGDTGTIYCFQLDIARQVYACCTSSSDLAAALTAAPDPVAGGQNLTYTLSVTNLGPATASSVTLTDTLPASVTFVSASPGCVNLGGEVAATVGPLASGSASSFTVVVTPNVGGPITNILTVATFTPDPNPANNSATNVTTVNAPPIILGQPASQSAVAGAAVSFTVGAAGPSLAFQWKKAGTNLGDGGNISGSTTASLTVSNVQAADLAAYSVGVSNSYGSLVSSNALLTLWPLVGWGQNLYTQADIPPGLASVVGLAGGLYHSLALRTDGTVAAWGAGQANSGLNPQFGQAMVPAGLADVVRLAGGYYHSLALKADGTVTAWGAGTNATGVNPYYGQALVPAAATGVVAIAAGACHNLALKANGTVVAWGAGTNTGSSPHFGQSAVPTGLTNVVAIAAGIYHSLALKSDGTVVAWGAGTNSTGGNPNYGQSHVPAGLSDVVAIAGGGYHSLALKADGTVIAWGAGTNDTGVGPDFGQARVPSGVTNVAAIAAGLYHTLALKADGTVVAWGLNNNGQTNTPGLLANGVAVAGGGYHSLVLEGYGAPHFTVQPFTRKVAVGTTVKLAAIAAGLQPVSYQWQRDGTNLAGATTNTLTLASVQCSDAGAYTLLATNSLGITPSSTAALTIARTIPPAITCPADVTVSADAGTCAATGVALGRPLTDDPCGTATVTNNRPASYPLGTNVVTWTVTDTDGNTNSCQQRVIVLDHEAPAIVWHLTNLVLAAGTNCQALLPNMTGTNYIIATDTCSPVIVTQSVAPNTALGLGTNEVVLGTSDAAGNVAYRTNYVVVVDQTPPAMACPTNIVVNADEGQCSKSNVTWAVTASDICGVTNLVSEPSSGSTFPAGVTAVRCTATDTAGNTNSCIFTVTVVAPTYILAQPVSQFVTQGADAAFTVIATNNCGIAGTYQWRWNAGKIVGATNSAYTRTNVQCADAGSFDVVLASAGGSQTSSVATLTVVAPPVILSGPAGQTVPLGQDATFCITTTNNCGGQLAYHWRFQGVEIPGATTNCYTFTATRFTNTGNYDVVVTNLAAAVTSPIAVLTVVGPYLTVSPVASSPAGGGPTNFAFTFPSVAGVDYVVQYKDILANISNWLPLVTNTGTGGFITNDFPITTDVPRRFYRVLVP